MDTPEATTPPVFVGRSLEMEALERAFRAAQAGVGRCVLLAGEAGIGKSRLAAELAQRARASKFLLVQGHCSEPDSSFPYGLWIDALRALLAPRGAAEASTLLGAFAPELVKLLPEL